MSIYDKKGLVSKETAMLHRWESETHRFAINQVDKGQISTSKSRRDNEDDVSSDRPSSSLSD